MNIASNPWSFSSTDVNTAALAASPTGLVLNADGSVTMTTSAPATFAAGQFITVIGATAPVYNGFYFLQTATSTTVYQLLPQPFVPNRIPAGTAASGGGTAILNQYGTTARVEDMSWEALSSDTAVHTLDVRDRNGNIVWQAFYGAAAPAAAPVYAPSQARGKVFWVQGISINVLTSNSVLLMTVN